MLVLLSVVAIVALAASEPASSDPRCASLDTACGDLYLAIECATFKQCLPRWEEKIVHNTPNGNDTKLCATCKTMVQDARNTLLSNLTQDELRQVLEGSCNVLVPIAGFNKLCKELMDTFQVELNDMLVSRMDPTQVCTVSGLCWKSAQSDIAQRSSQLFLQKSTQNKCTKCQSSVQKLAQLTKYVPTNDIVEGFSAALNNDGFDKTKRDTFAQTYVAKFVHIFNHSPPEKMCQFFGRCQGSIRPMPTRPITDGLECEFCEAMMHKLIAELDNASTKNEVKTVLEHSCQYAGPLAAECRAAITADFEGVYDDLISILKTSNLCTLVGLCPGKQTLPTVPMIKLSPARRTRRSEDYYADERSEEFSENCSVCTTAMSWVFLFANGRKHRVVIKFSLDEVCNKYPNILIACKRFKDTYSGRILDLVERQNAKTAQEVCSRLALCPETLKLLAFTGLQTKPDAESECEICQTALAWIASQLNSTCAENDIIRLVQRVCDSDWFADSDRQSCRNTISAYGSMIIHLLVHRMDPRNICSELRLCATSRAVKQVAKGSVCKDCVQIATYIVNAVNDNTTEENIRAVLENTCVAIPMDAAKCQQYIDTNVDKLYELLRDKVTVDHICNTLRLCETRAAAAVVAALPKPKGPECELCSVVVGYIQNELKDNKTDAAIVATLEKVCVVLPVNKVSCLNFIETYGSQVINLIKKDVSSREICTLIGFCSPLPTCEFCEFIANYVIQEFKDNKTDADIVADLDKVCELFPVERAQCRSLVDRYAPLIIRAIEDDVSPRALCATIGFCSTRSQNAVKVHGDNCIFCKLIADFLDKELKNNSTDAAIVAALEKVCVALPVDPLECRNIIDVYGNLIINMIKNNVDVDEICVFVHLCDANAVAAAAPRIERPVAYELRSTKPSDKRDNSQTCVLCKTVVDVVGAELQNNNNSQKEIRFVLEKACLEFVDKDQILCRNMVHVYTTYLINMIEEYVSAENICQTLEFCLTPPTTFACETCMLIINVADEELSDKRTEAEIQKVLDRVCDFIPGMEKAQCRETINQLSDMIITLLVEKVSPREICAEIKSCPSSEAVTLRLPALLGDEQCAFCKWLVTWVDDKVQDNRTESVIIEELDKACDLLSDSAECKSMVNDYVDTIVKMLVQYAEPEKICEAIKKCAKPQLKKEQPPCRYCKYVVEAVRADLPKTENELKQKLEVICRSLPVDPTECQRFVDQYADKIVHLILDNGDSERICELLGVCTKKIRATLSKCEFCTGVVDFIASEVKDDTTDSIILSMLENVCRLVPAIQREDCHRLIEIDGLIILRMIAENLNSDSICEMIKFCPNKKEGRLSCTWCQYALHFVQEKLYDNSTQQVIRKKLEEMCSKLPEALISSECKEFVDSYGSSLDVILAEDLDPSIICPAIHACPANSNGVVARPSRPRSTQRCHSCVSALRSYRHNSSQICEGVMPQMATKCIETSVIGVGLVNAFESDYNICKYAKACSDFDGRFSCNRGGCHYIR